MRLRLSGFPIGSNECSRAASLLIAVFPGRKGEWGLHPLNYIRNDFFDKLVGVRGFAEPIGYEFQILGRGQGVDHYADGEKPAPKDVFGRDVRQDCPCTFKKLGQTSPDLSGNELPE